MKMFDFDLMRFSTVVLTDGDDNYSNPYENPDTKILAQGGNDTINNQADNVTIDGGTGSNRIYNDGNTVFIDLKNSSGNNSVRNFARGELPPNLLVTDQTNNSDNVCIDGAQGDRRNNGGDCVTIRGGSGNDSIENNGGEYISIDGGAGDDTINNNGFNVNIAGGEGDDTINNEGDCVTIDGGTGSNRIYNDGNTVSIDLKNSSGRNFVRNFGGELPPDLLVTDRTNNGDNVTIRGGARDDTIVSSGDNVSIDGGSGNDSIENDGGKATIFGGAGDDTINNSGFGANIDGGDGNDKINAFASGTINGGSNDDTIIVAGGDLSVNGGDGNDKIVYTGNCYSDVTLGGGTGNNTILVEDVHRGLLVKTGSGNDLVELKGTVGGSANPAITTVQGSGGTDTILGYTNSTLGTLYKFDPNQSGLTTIYNVIRNDTISFGGEYQQITLASSNDVTLTSGKMTTILKDAKNISFTVDGKVSTDPPQPPDDPPQPPDDPPQPPDDPPQPTVTPQKVLLDFNKYLDNNTSDVGIKKVDNAIDFASGGYYSSAQDVIDDMVRTRLNYPAGDEGSRLWLKMEMGIDFTNDDTGSILGLDAGGEKSLNAEDVVPEVGELDRNFTDSSFFVDGVKFTLAKWIDFNTNRYQTISFDELNTDDQRYMWQASKTWWISNSLKLIEDSYGYKYTESGSTVKEVLIMFVNDPNDPTTQDSGFQQNWLQCTSYPSYSNGKVYKSAITFNMNYYNSFAYNDKDGVSPAGQIHADRCFSHENLHSIMSSCVDYYHLLPAYIKEGLCDALHGGDFRSYNMTRLANDTEKIKLSLNPASSYATVSGVGNPSYVGGITFVRYLGKHGAEHYGETNLNNGEAIDNSAYINLSNYTVKLSKGFSGKLDLSDFPNATKVDATKLTAGIEIIGSSASNVLQSGAGSDTIHTNNSNNTVSSGAGNDIVYSEGKANKVDLGDGDDTIYCGATSTTVTSGAGKDVFVHTPGGDITIADYTAGQDKLQLDRYENVASGTVVNGKDVKLQVGTNSILVKDAVGKKLTVVDGEGKSTTRVYNDDPTWKFSGTTATYSTTSKTLVTVSGVKSLKGISLKNKTVTISADALNAKPVTISSGYTLALGSNVPKVSKNAASWTNKSGTYTYTAAKTSAGYSLSGNKISYTPASGGDKFTITGLKSSATPLKSNTGIKVDSKGVVTLSAKALDGKSVTLVNDTKDGANEITYKLAVDSSVSTKATTTKAAWTKKSSTFTYTAPITSAFYTLKGNALNYTAKKGGEQFSVTGLKDTNAVTVSGKKVTVGNASLNGKNVTLTGDYTLALAKGVATSAKKTAGVFSTVSKGTATYKTTSFSGYYKLSGKKISYTAATGGQAITIKNLNTSANLAAVKKGITVAEQKNGSYLITFKTAGVLTTKAPTVSAAKGVKYTVAVADSLKPVTKAAAWNINGTTAILRSDTTAGYTVNSKNAVVYTAQKNGSPLVELTNLAKGVKASSITTKGKVVTLNASVLGTKTAIKSNNGGYSFSLTGNASGKKFTGTSKVDTLIAASNANIDAGAGNDVVTVSGLKVTLNGGAGNDTLTVTGKNNIIYGGAGSDTIVSQNSGNTLSGGKDDDQLWGSTKFADVFIYNKGDGHETIKFFDKNDLLQITGTNAITGTYNSSKKEIYFSVASTSKAITLTDFGKTTTFHVNNDTYQLQNNQLIKK